MAKKQQTGKTKGRSTVGRVKLTLQIIIFLFLVTILAGLGFFYLKYGKTILQLQEDAKQKVSASTTDTFKASQTSVIYDAEGNTISTLKSEKDVFYLNYEDIPQIAVDSMIVSEDRNFFEHDGVDYLANVRAAIALIKHKGEITQGASTITQQVVKNVFLSQEVTYKRKIEEIFAAQEMERMYSKDQIMEFYLNGIYFANGHYGIQAAAQGYFGEGVSGLSISQIVFLCAIPNNPNLYNPLTNMDNTLKRRDRILEQLLSGDMISHEEYLDALNETITLHTEKTEKQNYIETYTFYCAIRALMKASGFEFQYEFDSDADREAYDKEYEELYDQYQKALYTHGYRIYTSFDLNKQELLQTSVDKALKNFKDVNKEGIYQMQGAAVCIDNDTGRVVAIVGGRDQNLSGYTLNRGYQSFRQPGSSIKPLIVYTPIFEQGYTPVSTVIDEKFKGGPKNAENSYLGKMKLQRAIELSKNTVAWKLFQELTPKVGLSYLLKMNFSKITSSDYVPAAALGGLTTGVSPVEMAAAYSTLENDGKYRVPTCIVKIMDAEGNELVSDEMETKQIYQTNAARLMTEALMGVIKNGTGKGLGLINTVSAGKTGTTNDKKDGWFVGYTPYYTTSVWVGYDIPKSVADLKGATYPGTIWHMFMEEIHTPSMDHSFVLYDWKSVIKDAKEQEDRIQEEKKTEEVIPEETVPEEDKPTLPADTSDTEGADNSADIGTTVEDNTGDSEEVPADNTEDTTGDTTDTVGDTTAGDTTGTGATTGTEDNTADNTGGQTTDDTTVDGTTNGNDTSAGTTSGNADGTTTDGSTQGNTGSSTDPGTNSNTTNTTGSN